MSIDNQFEVTFDMSCHLSNLISVAASIELSLDISFRYVATIINTLQSFYKAHIRDENISAEDISARPLSIDVQKRTARSNSFTSGRGLNLDANIGRKKIELKIASVTVTAEIFASTTDCGTEKKHIKLKYRLFQTMQIDWHSWTAMQKAP